ncbi:ferric reductase-like transmembrane domain-containing protein [Nonomuraea insulae]|uniref:Ferric reductase-like transmembrane domain-containing protein n=1 Tax=Nonomuraea insulae TaxID=1616787 RepID=A0ABW1CHR5_9ACTN
MSTTTAPRATHAKRRPRSLWKADLLGVLAIASVVLTVWIWARTGGFLQTFVYPQYAIESQALLTGLLSQTLMALQVIYLARIPWVEQSWGHDLLAHRHRLLGYWSFWLMMAHVVLFAITRAGEGRGGGPLAALYQVFIGDSWMLLTSLGTFMIIVVVVTSIRVARERLRYESWHLIHLYSYLGMALAFPHQIFDGTHFHDLWTQAFWWIMLLAAFITTLVYRVYHPLRRSLRHRLRVIEVKAETPGVSSIVMEGRDLDRLRTKSGQFFIWRFLGGSGWTRGHPYTISAAPRPDRLRITVQAIGDGSDRATKLGPGTRVMIEGPYGTLTEDVRRHPHMVVIAAGVGITPFTGILQDAPYEPGEVTLIYRISSIGDAIHLDELEELAQRRGITPHLLVGPRRAPGSWLPGDVPADLNDEHALGHLAPGIAHSDVFVCGPQPWNDLVRDSLKAAGVSKHDIHIEDYSW